MTAVDVILPWLGFVFIALAAIGAMGVAGARAHFTICVHVAAVAVLAALAALCFRAPLAALAIILVGVGIVPTLMLGGVLLSTRATRDAKGGAQRLVLVAAGIAAMVLIWGTQDATRAVHLPTQPLGVGAWLTPLVMLAGLICTGLLGYGERGALLRDRAGRGP